MSELWKNRLILCPTDFSPPAEAAFDMACSLARDYGARVELLHVANPVVSIGDVVASRKDGFRDDLRERLRQARPADPGVGVTHLLLEGDPAEVIVEVARGHRCELIVLGTHGRTGLCRMILGSVAEHVLRNAPCPVLTVKARPSDGEQKTDVVEPALCVGL